MRMTERVTLSVIFGAVPICICFVAGWWISIPLVPESLIPLCALAVFFVGVVVDILFLSTWVRLFDEAHRLDVGLSGLFRGDVRLLHGGSALPRRACLSRRLFCRGMAGSSRGGFHPDEEGSEGFCRVHDKRPRHRVCRISRHCPRQSLHGRRPPGNAPSPVSGYTRDDHVSHPGWGPLPPSSPVVAHAQISRAGIWILCGANQFVDLRMR